MQQLQKKLQHTAVIGAAVIGAVLAVGVLSAQSAIAQSSVVANYNPLTQQTATYSVFETSPSTDETISVTITGFSFVPSVLGTFDLIESQEEPGNFVSDQITISNTGANGSGLIHILSSDVPISGMIDPICNGPFATDEDDNPICKFTLPLANSNGTTLLATFMSDPFDSQNSNPSDTLTIVTAPEPASLTVIGSALAAMGLLGWRRRKEV